MKQVEVYRAANVQEAQVLKNVLEHEGIHALISNEALLGATDMAGWGIDPRVIVGEADVDLAMPIVDEFVQQVLDRRNRDVGETDADFSEPERDWPRCPKCDDLRMAMCTGCHTVGTDFGEAVFVETQTDGETGRREIEFEIEPEELLLMCTVCDRPFQPVYSKTCRCNYEFEDGFDFDWNRAAKKSSARFVLILITIIAAIAIGYLYLFRMS